MSGISINQMTMKNWSKYFYLIGLAVITYGLPAIHSYGQQPETTEVPESLKIYGGGTIQAAYSMMNYPGEAGFSPALILMEDPANPNPKLVLDAGAKLGLEKSILWEEDNIKLVAETAVSKKGEASLKKATAEFKNWMVGLGGSNFCDPSVMPETLGGSPSSAVYKRAVQLRWKQQINPIFSYAVSIEEAAKFELYPEKEENKLAQPNNDIPALTTSLRYNYPDSSGHLHIGGLVRALEYYHTEKKESYYSLAFGANLGTEVKLLPEKTSLKGHVVYGQGIGGYIVDLALLNEKEVNTAYHKTDSSALNTIDAWGLYAAVEHRWVPKLRSTVASGLLSTINDKDRPKQHYKRGVYASANLTYHPTEQFHFGVEYLHGLRTNINDKSVHAGCIQAIASFQF